jgi:hypothetical protein
MPARTIPSGSLTRIFGEQASVRRVDARHHWWLIVLEQRIVRKVLFVFPNDPGKNRGCYGEQQCAGSKYETNNASNPAHLSIKAFPSSARYAETPPTDCASKALIL